MCLFVCLLVCFFRLHIVYLHTRGSSYTLYATYPGQSIHERALEEREESNKVKLPFFFFLTALKLIIQSQWTDRNSGRLLPGSLKTLNSKQSWKEKTTSLLHFIETKDRSALKVHMYDCELKSYNHFPVLFHWRWSFRRWGGLVVSALVSGSSGPGSSPTRGYCVVFLGKTLYSHDASLHPGL